MTSDELTLDGLQNIGESPSFHAKIFDGLADLKNECFVH